MKQELYCTKRCETSSLNPKFSGTARISETWICNQDGDWEETADSENISSPDSYTCAHCGAVAAWRAAPDKPKTAPLPDKVWIIVLGDGETWDSANVCELIQVPANRLKELQNDSKLLREAESFGWKIKPVDF
jgi:hypothetical protein